jgi:hypothetical protein
VTLPDFDSGPVGPLAQGLLIVSVCVRRYLEAGTEKAPAGLPDRGLVMFGTTARGSSRTCRSRHTASEAEFLLGPDELTCGGRPGSSARTGAGAVTGYLTAVVLGLAIQSSRL